jgi:hypothetical protein
VIADATAARTPASASLRRSRVVVVESVVETAVVGGAVVAGADRVTEPASVTTLGVDVSALAGPWLLVSLLDEQPAPNNTSNATEPVSSEL